MAFFSVRVSCSRHVLMERVENGFLTEKMSVIKISFSCSNKFNWYFQTLDSCLRTDREKDTVFVFSGCCCNDELFVP